MSSSRITAEFDNGIEDVWDVVTSLENYKWRSDIEKVEVIREERFVEHTKDGFVTEFTTTVYDPLKRWEFDMENDNMKGHWTGVFSHDNGKTKVEFTENVTAKKLILKPFVKGYLRKQQLRYISDLRKRLEHIFNEGKTVPG